MNINGKVILIVILGICACLASFLIGHYFPQSHADSLHRNLNWILVASIFCVLSLSGAMLLARDVIRFVDDRRENRENHRGSEKLLSDITENVPGVVYRFAAARDFVYHFDFLSQKAREIFGLEPDPETFYDEFGEYLPDGEKERFFHSIRDAVERVAPWNYEGRFIRPDGKTIWFSGNSVPRKEGKNIAFDGVLMDITRRKEMESSLRLTRFCFDHAAIGIYQIGMNGRILDVNAYAAEMLGYTIEELKGLSTFDIDAFIHESTMAEDLDRIVVNERGGFETVHIRKDGSRIEVEINNNILEYEGQQYSFSFVQDISERKRIEESLRLTQFIFDKAPISIWRIGEAGEVLDVNEQGCASLGYTREELCRMTVFDISPGLDKKKVEKSDRVLRRTGTGILETDQRRKNGEIFPIQSITKLMYYKNRQVRVAFVQDITERKQSEAALRENERLLGNILESMDEAVSMIDGNYNYMIFNKKFEELTGFSRGRVIGKSPWEIFSNFRDSITEKNIFKAMEGHVTNGCEVLVSPPDEKATWFRESYSPIKDDGGHVIGVVTVASDITARKEYEEELKRLQNYLVNIIDSMPSQLIGVDKNGRITQWNQTVEAKTGIAAVDAQGKAVAEVLPRMASEMRKISDSIAARKTIQEQRIPRKLDDGVAYEDITIFPLTANGVEGAVIRVDDVTERVRMEEMMVQSEKMLSVGGLAAGMAHEINNPLAGMLQTAEVMASRLGGDLDIPANRRAAEAAGITLAGLAQFMEARGIPRMLGAVSESGKRVASIVQNMLAFARKPDASVSSHQLGDLLDAAAELAAHDYDLKKEYDFKRIEIRREYTENMIEVPCEAGKIQQVLLNILRNGARAMQGAGGQSPRFVFRTRFDADRRMAIMEIEDNGPGMDEKTRRRIFEPFFTTKPVGEGTGLGMSVSYFIITENHGGEMTVDSRPGAGTTFTVRLPVGGQKAK